MVALITITGNDVRDSTGRPDNRPWTITASTYQDGAGGVITDKTSTALYPIAGVLTFQVEAGITAWIRTPDEVRYLVRIPDSDADLWALIEAGVAYPPNTAQDLLAAAVGQYVLANAQQFRSYAEPVDPEDPDTLWQWKDGTDGDIGDPVDFTDIIPEAVAEAATAAVAEGAVDADLASRSITFTDEGGGEGYFSVGGVPVSGTVVPPAATWSGLSGIPYFPVTSSVGDDATDALAAIQAAVDAAEAAGGGVVLVPPGVYRVSASVVMNSDNVTLQGSGRSATVLKTLGDFPIIQWQSSAVGLCVRDLQLLGDADSGKTAQRGIEVINASDGLVHNVWAKDLGYDGLCMLRGSVRNTISHCLVENCQDDGINIGGSTLGNSTDNVIVGNIVKDSGSTGIHLSDGSSYTTVTGNLIVDCGEDGINTFQTGGRVGLGNHSITGNVIRDCADFGIRIRDSDSNVVSGNAIHGSQRSLRAVNTAHSVFTGNRCEDATIGSFLDDTGCTDLTIADNVCSGTTSHIFIEGPRAVVQGNSVRGATGANFASIYTASTAIGCLISNNVLSGGYQGVHVVAAAADCVVTSNVISDMSSHGIRVDGDDCVVASNSLKDITSNAIYLNAAERAHVVGNHINTSNVGISIGTGVDCHVADNYTVSSTTASISENGASSATTVVHNRFDSTVTVNGTGSVRINATESSAYTPSNVATDRAFDANSTSTDELADVLGTLIADLQANGIIG